MLPRHMTLSLWRAESAKAVPWGRMNPLRRRMLEPPSDGCDESETDLLDNVDDMDGSEAEPSSEGQAPRARDGDTLGDGEAGRRCGEVARRLDESEVLVPVLVRGHGRSRSSIMCWAACRCVL